MSVKMRIVWIYPAIVVASWLVVRSLAASPDLGLEDPPVPLTSVQQRQEIKDVSLAHLIGRLAAAARAERQAAR